MYAINTKAGRYKGDTSKTHFPIFLVFYNSSDSSLFLHLFLLIHGLTKNAHF